MMLRASQEPDIKHPDPDIEKHRGPAGGFAETFLPPWAWENWAQAIQPWIDKHYPNHPALKDKK